MAIAILFFYKTLENLPLVLRAQMWFMLNGAPQILALSLETYFRITLYLTNPILYCV